MNYAIKVGSSFKRELKRLCKRYRSLYKDYDALLTELETNPAVGVDLGGGLRKVRMTITDKGKGKSHGARVITYTVVIDEKEGVITLLYLYDKAERSSISHAEIAVLLQEMED